MPAPLSPAPPALLPGKVSPGTKVSYSSRLLADFQALLRKLDGAPRDATLKLGENQQRADFGPQGAGTRPVAAASDRDEPGSAVDPMALSLANALPSAMPPGEPTNTLHSVTAPQGPGAIDAVLAAEVLQRVAWGGDRRRGVARLELGGEFAGAVVVVRSEGGEVALDLTLPTNLQGADLAERLSARLVARGLVVREVVVH
jgi:hypothetical protein